MARRKKKKRQKWSDFTLDEQFTIIMIGISLIFITLHYILAFLGKDPLENLATVWITAIVLVLYKYSIKSFAGKREEEKIKYLRDKNGVIENDIIQDKDDLFDDFIDMRM